MRPRLRLAFSVISIVEVADERKWKPGYNDVSLRLPLITAALVHTIAIAAC